jgi:zinc transporter, ZIP family
VEVLAAGFWGFVGGRVAARQGAPRAVRRRLPARHLRRHGGRSGILISSVAFELIEESYESGGFGASAFGLLSGAVVYFAADRTVSRRAKHRKRSLGQQ